MRVLIPFLIVVVLLSACGGEESAQPTVTQAALQATLPATNTSFVETTESPTVSPTEQPAQPTQTSVEPTDTPEPNNTPEPTATQVATATNLPEPTVLATPVPAAEGNISFGNNLAVADQLMLTMTSITSPPSGFVYEGWLIADDGISEISTGVIEVTADGRLNHTWTSPTGENLIAQYIGFAITVEPAGDSDPSPSNKVAFKGAVDPEIWDAARRVFTINESEPATPRNISFGQGMLTESQIATDHILNAFNGAAIGAFGEMRVHAEHVINVIEGTTGPRFADYTGDGRAENPGDGFGALTYARQIAALLTGESEDFKRVESLLIGIQDKAEEILAAPDIASAQPFLDDLKAMAEQLVNEATPIFYATVQATLSYSIMPTP